MNMHDAGHLPVEGGSLYYEVDGDPDASALTLIHAGVAHLRMWDEHLPALTERHRVIRYDTRGFGQTRSEDVEFSDRDDVRALLDHLEVGDTHLLGISRGGGIALDTALEAPDRVRSLILVASVPSGFAFEMPELDEMWAEVERLEESCDWPAVVRREVEIWTDGIGQSPDRVPAEVRERMTRWGMENYTAEPGNGRPRRAAPRAAGRLAEVTQPTFVMWGDLDEMATQKGSEAMAAGIPGARSHTFAGVAHMVDLERPHEFERLVLDFLAEVDAV